MRAGFVLSLLMGVFLSFPGIADSKPKKNAPASSALNITTLVFSGRFSEAEAALSEFGKKTKGPWKERLRFIAAYVELQSGDKAKAAKLFSELDPKGPLKNYIVYYRALALRESGQAKEAIALLNELSGQSLPPNLSAKISRDLALAYCKTGDRGQAVDRLNALIQTEASPAKTYRLRFDRARCLLDLSDKADAAAGFATLYRSEPEGDMSAQILAALKEADPSYRVGAAEHRARAELLMERKRPDLAVLDFEEALRLSAPAPVSLKKQMAEAYYKARRYREAASAFEDLRADPASGFSEDDLANLARAYSRSDQFDSAIAVYRDLSGGAENDYKIAFVKMDQGKLEEANRLFTELLAAYPQHPRRSNVEWFMAWNHYQLKNYSEAEARFGELQAKAGKEKSENRAAYWRARSLEGLKRGAEANAIYAGLADDDNLPYYALLSLKRMEKLGGPTQAPRRGAVHGLPRLKLPSPFSLGNLESEGGKEPLRRLKELLLVGLWEDFLAELDFVAAREAVAENFSGIRNESAGSTAQDSGTWGAKFPPAYATLVTLFTQTRGIPAALAWAIMREESRFRPQVVSPANAIGLMQIIPPTGAEIATYLRRSSFSPEDLYRPVVNVEYGVQYLAMNLKRFSGNLIYTIASYNAGPEAVERWKKARPNREWEEFVEEIPYAETQEYVRKVLRSFYLYSLLYGLDEKAPGVIYSGK
jgi:soluble lytic murein transglycosylase